jgi:hypothetical protein
VKLDKASHFTAPDGADVLVAAGNYRIEGSTGTNTLRLVADATQVTREIPATSFIHEETLAAPLAFVVREQEHEDAIHLLLLLPGGQGLDAAGRRGDVQTRGGAVPFRSRTRYTAVVMQEGRVQLDADMNEQGSLPSPSAGAPQSQANHYGRVTLEQGRVQLDADARKSLLEECKVCTKAR